jgi:hypothetical protein
MPVENIRGFRKFPVFFPSNNYAFSQVSVTEFEKRYSREGISEPLHPQGIGSENNGLNNAWPWIGKMLK